MQVTQDMRYMGNAGHRSQADPGTGARLAGTGDTRAAATLACSPLAPASPSWAASESRVTGY